MPTEAIRIPPRPPPETRNGHRIWHRSDIASTSNGTRMGYLERRFMSDVVGCCLADEGLLSRYDLSDPPDLRGDIRSKRATAT